MSWRGSVNARTAIREIGFHGSDFRLERLLWILVPRVLRAAGRTAQQGIPEVEREDFPPRTDGGYGWFVVQEGAIDDYGDVGGQNTHTLAADQGFFHYYWIARYFSGRLDNTLGAIGRRVRPGFIRVDGTVDAGLDEELAATMLEIGLAEKRGEVVSLAVLTLTKARNQALAAILDEVSESIAPGLGELAQGILEEYKRFTPERLHSQICGVIGGYLNNAVGMVVGQLEEQGNMPESDTDESPARSVMVEVAEPTP